MALYLLDTHVFLWFVMGDRRLGREVNEIIRNAAGRAYLSIASIWEVSIKQGLSKLPPLTTDLEEVMSATGLILLSMSIEHAKTAGSLPLLHRDPFNRMLVAQAQIEDPMLITNDPKIEQYDVDILRP